MSFYQNKKILVTGGTGFIGSHLVEALVKEKAKVVVTTLEPVGKVNFLDHVRDKIEIKQVDLKEKDQVRKVIGNQDYIFHLAAHVAGIHFNNSHPATLFYDNVLPVINVIEEAKNSKIDRLLIVSSACVYPRFCTIPTPESEGFKGEPEPTNFGYGWAKRFAEVLAKTYHQEFGLKIGVVRPYNVYGPRDNFGPESHVIPALIKRLHQDSQSIEVWGDGSPTRSFIYVKDVVQGMLLALAKHPQPDAINLGTREEISIKDLVKMLIKLSGRKVKVKFNEAKPNGQPRRNCDTTKAEKLLGFRAKTRLNKGLPEVINYYRQHVQKKD